MGRFQSRVGRSFQFGLGIVTGLGLGIADAVAQIVPDGTLGAEGSQVRSLSPTNLRIEGGATRGVNLFHSFRDFNVGDGHQVYFANPIGIETILGRVTGQNLSNIQGTLGVDGGASLFLLNPNGFVFGPNARLDIRGSFLVSGGDRFSFPDGQEFSAVNPQGAPLLTLNVTPGLQLGRANSGFTGAIAAQGNLAVGGDLTLAGTQVSVRDAIAQPTILGAGKNLTIQGSQGVDLSLLGHAASGLFSGEDMSLRADAGVLGDAHFSSGGTFQVQGLAGQPGRLISPQDPVIRAAGDVVLGEYEGASLHVLAGGSVTIPSVTITGVGVPASSLVETVALSRSLPDGTTVVQVDGVARPTLDVRAGTTAFGTPTQGSGAATSGNISIDQITVNQPNGLVFLTNQYQPNALPGAIAVKSIETRNPGGSGTVVLDSRGDIGVQAYGVIRTSGQRGATVGAAGDVALLANGAVTLGERSLIQARGYGSGAGGDIAVLANSLTLNNRTQLDSSTFGSGRGGDIAIALGGDLTMRGTNTRIASLVEAGGTGRSGNIRVDAQSLAITNGAGIFNGVAGQGTGGNIELNVRDQVLIDGTGGGSNSAIMNALYPGSNGVSGDIVLRSGSLRLTDGGLITTEAGEGALGQSGNINAVVQGDVLISGVPVDKTLPDISGPPGSGSGKVDVFFLADNSGSMGGTINIVQRNSSNIFQAVKGGDPRFNAIDVGLGVGSYVDDPFLGLNDPDYSYQVEQTITADQQLAKIAIDKWSTSNRICRSVCYSFGTPEGNFFALQQVATSGQPTLSGFGTGFQTGWRDGAERVVVWFGDAVSVEQTINQAETINALQSNQVKVIAINTESAGRGIDTRGQASAIAAATGGVLRNRINTSGVTDLILGAISDVLSPDFLSITAGDCSPTCVTSSRLAAGAAGNGVGPVATGGNIKLQAQTLSMNQFAGIQSLVGGEGTAGDIEVTAPVIDINGLAGIGNFGVGLKTNTGAITVNSSNLTIQGLSSISSTLYGIGTSGDININSGQINLQAGGAIATTSFGVTTSGNLNIKADDIRLKDASVIQTTASGASQPGALTLNARNLALESFSSIGTVSATAASFNDAINNQAGPALNSTLDPRVAAVFLGGLQSISGLNDLLSQTANQGNSSTLRLNVTQDTTLQAGAIATLGLGSANGGDLLLKTGNLILTDDSLISSKSAGTGIAGMIDIAARDRLLLNNSEISASAAQSDGGNINLSANSILLRNGSLVSTSVFDSFGGGGNITINSRSFVAIENSDILANAEKGPGGDIFIQSPAFLASLFSSGRATPVGRNPGSFDRFRTNNRVDISADSASGQSGTVTYPNVDPARGLVQLPVVFSDRSRIRNLCKAEGNRPGRAYRDKFIITGRGGVAETPFDTVRSLPSDPPPWVQPPSTTLQAIPPTSTTHTPTRQPLTEATTLHQTPDGRIHLIAAQPILNPIQRPCTATPGIASLAPLLSP